MAGAVQGECKPAYRLGGSKACGELRRRRRGAERQRDGRLTFELEQAGEGDRRGSHTLTGSMKTGHSVSIVPFRCCLRSPSSRVLAHPV